MTLAQSGAEALISEFGEEITVVKMDNESPDDPDDPIFINSSGSEVSRETHKVRLYTSPSKEMMEDYGFDEDTGAIMYSTKNITEEGDRVEYEPNNTEWVVKQTATNQIGGGPYLYIYRMTGV